MLLTPIRIRGKRRAKDEPPTLPILKRTRVERKRRTKKSRPPKVSFIEKEIPLEVLERIFWLSENVNLPRASPLFGRLLSGAPTLRKTFLNAFGPTWDVWYGCIRDARPDSRTIHSYVGWEDDVDRFGGNPEFQSAILEYPWANISFILKCWDLWVHRYAKHRHFEHTKIWSSPESPSADMPAATPDNAQGARHYFFQDYHDFRQVEKLNRPDLVALYHRGQRAATWIEVHPNTRIPDSLLMGPWSEEALQKLFWLVRAGARLSPDQTWELTLQGFHNAIADPTPTSGSLNLTVLRLFDILKAFETWPQYIREEELEKIDRVSSTSLDSSGETRYRYSYILTLMSDFEP
ncbi:hypothetical protein F4809DRAFT_416991 [Biscogniauxia mediterranea]|nr:hypothetical protein F4809DRAFT_416991 [Biscogniauxia mediterranea]